MVGLISKICILIGVNPIDFVRIFQIILKCTSEWIFEFIFFLELKFWFSIWMFCRFLPKNLPSPKNLAKCFRHLMFGIRTWLWPSQVSYLIAKFRTSCVKLMNSRKCEVFHQMRKITSVMSQHVANNKWKWNT